MSNRFTDKAEASLNKVIEAFRDGTIAEKCATATFPMPDIPASRWTIANRWLALAQSGEADCRGFRQWKAAGRSVRKGERSAYILRPMMAKGRAKDGAGDDEEQRCVGFAPVAVFAASQTEGEPLEYEDVKVPDLPLLDVAEAWGIDVSAQPFLGKFLGRFQRRVTIASTDIASIGAEEQRIILFSPDAEVFLHELTHASHSRVRGGLKPGQDPIQEIVAELGAEVLRRIVGADKDSSGNAYAYIERYAAEKELTVLDACLRVLHETAKVVGLILETAEAVASGSAESEVA